MKGTPEPVPTKKDAISYVRIASRLGPDQKRRVLAIQNQRCHFLAKDHGAVIVDEFRDIGSTRSADRPGLAAMLRRVRRGDIDYVVVATSDRLTRSLGEYSRLEAAIAGAGAELVVHAPSPMDRFAKEVRKAWQESLAAYACDECRLSRTKTSGRIKEAA